jgi:hypothetical protein
MRPSSRALFALPVLLVLAGCGSDRPPLGRVSGTVNYNGQPVASGAVVFEVSGARPAHAKIVNGEITEVTTYDPNDGVPVGLARIAVFATDSSATSPSSTPSPAADPGSYRPGANYMGAGAKPLVPRRYNDPSTSGLTWQIEKGKNEVTLDLSD